MFKRTVCSVVCMATIFFHTPVRCAVAGPGEVRSPEHYSLKQMRTNVKRGLTHVELVRRIGEPDYCVGEYLECRYTSADSCITNGVRGVRTLVIWFEDNRVTSSDILCVAE